MVENRFEQSIKQSIKQSFAQPRTPRHTATARLVRVALLAGAALLASTGARAAHHCEPADGLEFVCGLQNAEDVLMLPGTRWIIASGMSAEDGSHSGHLYVVDADSRAFEEVYPAAAPVNRLDRNAFPACPGDLDPGAFSAHGISLHRVRAGTWHLYTTSHGAREAVEVFEIDATGAKPTVAWVGCVPIPEHNDINSVAALSDGGFLATRISGTGPNAGPDIFAGDLSGFLYEWHPGGAVERVPFTEMSGPNGIVVSADEARVWVGSWGRGEVARFVRTADGGLRHDRTLPMSFRVDNLRWTPEGTLLAAGHRLSASQDCGQPLCFDEWEVAEIDPEAMTSRSLVIRPPAPGFLGATAAIRDGDALWLGTFHGTRIVRVAGPSGD